MLGHDIELKNLEVSDISQFVKYSKFLKELGISYVHVIKDNDKLDSYKFDLLFKTKSDAVYAKLLLPTR